MIHQSTALAKVSFDLITSDIEILLLGVEFEKRNTALSLGSLANHMNALWSFDLHV